MLAAEQTGKAVGNVTGGGVAGPGLIKLASRVGARAAQGAGGGAAFEAARGGGDPVKGAEWGAALEGAFPFLGRIFGTKAAKEAAAPVAKAATEAVTKGAETAATTRLQVVGRLS